MKENKKTAGRAQLAELEKAARKLGFEFIARKAAMART
jgi:hypothetical protein